MYITADGERFFNRQEAEQHERNLPARLRMADYAPVELVERDLHNQMTKLVNTIKNRADQIITQCNPDEDWPLAPEYVNSEEITRQTREITSLAEQLTALQDAYENLYIEDTEPPADSKVCLFDWCLNKPVNQSGWCLVHMDPKYWCHQCWQRHAVNGVGESAKCAECKKEERP